MTSRSIAELFEAAAAAFAALRLFHFELHRTQTAMFVFLLGTAFNLFILGSLAPDSIPYFWAFIATEFIGWVLAIMAVREMFALALERYAGIRTVVRRFMYLCLAGAGAISLGVERLAWSGGASGRSHLFYIQILNRSVVLTLAAFIGLFLLLLSRYPLHLRRNTLISCGFFCFGFISEAGAMIADTISPTLYSNSVDLAHLAFSTACLLGWAALVRREGDLPLKAPLPRRREEVLLRELSAFNAFVSRASRQ